MNNRCKIFLQTFRNCLFFSFAWLVMLSTCLTALFGKTQIGTSFLLKLLVFCVWASILFTSMFSKVFIRKKSFIFRMTGYITLFVPSEIAFFYWINLFVTKGRIQQWMIFTAVIVFFYVASLLLDLFYFAKHGEIYTFQLTEYQKKRRLERYETK